MGLHNGVSRDMGGDPGDRFYKKNHRQPLLPVIHVWHWLNEKMDNHNHWIFLLFLGSELYPGYTQIYPPAIKHGVYCPSLFGMITTYCTCYTCCTYHTFYTEYVYYYYYTLVYLLYLRIILLIYIYPFWVYHMIAVSIPSARPVVKALSNCQVHRWISDERISCVIMFKHEGLKF